MRASISDKEIDRNAIAEKSGYKLVMKFPRQYEATIKLTDTIPAYAVAIHKILLDEISTICLDTSACEMVCNDKSVIAAKVFNIINQIKVLGQPKTSGKKYSIHVQSNNQTDVIMVLSDHIMYDNSPADVEKGILICHLSPGCTFTVKNITTIAGIGLDNARFSAVRGPVSYENLDFEYVRFLQEGFVGTDYFPISKKDIPKNAIVQNLIVVPNKEWEKKINARDARFFKTLTPLYNVKQVTEDCKNFLISFKSQSPAREIALKAFARLVELLEHARHVDVSVLGEWVSLTFLGSETVGSILFEEIVKTCDVTINYKNIVQAESFTINIKHPAAKDVYNDAITTAVKTVEAMLKE